MKAELFQAVGGGTRGRPLTRGGGSPFRSCRSQEQWASPTSRTSWAAGRRDNGNSGAGQVLLGQYTGGSFGARNAAIHPGKGKIEPSAGGAGGLSGHPSHGRVRQDPHEAEPYVSSERVSGGRVRQDR